MKDMLSQLKKVSGDKVYVVKERDHVREGDWCMAFDTAESAEAYVAFISTLPNPRSEFLCRGPLHGFEFKKSPGAMYAVVEQEPITLTPEMRLYALISDLESIMQELQNHYDCRHDVGDCRVESSSWICSVIEDLVRVYK